jgi:YolD-like protein
MKSGGKSMHERGTIKWTSLMMPEHVAMIKEAADRELYDVSQPILSEDRMEELNSIIFEAHENNLQVYVQYFKNRRIQLVEGIISKVNVQQNRLEIEAEDGLDWVGFDELVDVSTK